MESRIKKAREQKGISQEKLSEKSGISRATISYLENNPNAVTTTETLKRLASALGVKPSYFLSN